MTRNILSRRVYNPETETLASARVRETSMEIFFFKKLLDERSANSPMLGDDVWK